MAHNVEPKMDELKRLLRRLDGLDGSKGAVKGLEEAQAEQHGYVGALRGAPVSDQDDDAPLALAMPEKKSSSSAVYIAAATAAAISTATVYLVMSWQAEKMERGAAPVPSSERVVPSKLDFKTPDASGTGQQRQSIDTADGLVRRAEQLLQGGDVATARILLQQAAELGSGTAALKLGRSYDPTQTETLRYADSQTNPALAKAWYERALALGTQEAASYISDPGAR